MTDYPEPDEPREAALRAAVLDFSAAVVRGGATKEELVAAMEAVRQIPIDLERMTNALHVPSDAGDYEDTLRALLERIPDGWGRWIQCGPGWYPILARLNERLEEFDPGYQILQIKEKFGTFASTWGTGITSSGRPPWPRPRPSRRGPASCVEVPATSGPGTRGYARSVTTAPSRRGTRTCPTTRRIRATFEMSQRGEARPGDQMKSAHLSADISHSAK